MNYVDDGAPHPLDLLVAQKERIAALEAALREIRDIMSGWIDIRKGEAGLWHAECVLIPSFHVSETSREEVLRQIPIVLTAMAETVKDGTTKAHYLTTT